MIDDELINELKEAFNLFDSQHTGQIDARELKAALKAFGLEVKKQDVRVIMKSINKEVNETIDFTEFANIMLPRIGSRDSRDEIEKIFRLLDEDNQGKISFKNLKKISQDIGENIQDEELYEMLEEADRDGDGQLNFEEFYRVMKRRENAYDDLDSDDD